MQIGQILHRLSGGVEASETGRRLRQCLSAYASNRKLVAGTLGLLALLVLLWPSSDGAATTSASQLCLGQQLRRWSREEAAFDVLVAHSPRRSWEPQHLAFVGNGHFGLGIGGGETVRLRGGRALSLTTRLAPLMRVSLTGDGLADGAAAIVSDLRRGVVSRILAYQRREGECVFVRTDVYAHRQQSRLLVQEIRVENPTDRGVELRLERRGGGLANDDGQKSAGTKDYAFSSGRVEVTPKTSISVGAALPILPKEAITVSAKGSHQIRFLSAVDVSEPGSSEAEAKPLLESSLRKALEEGEALSGGKLLESHVGVWARLWSPAFGLSYSRAPDVLNPLLINATRYALLSNIPASLHEASTTPEQRRLWLEQLSRPDLQCYHGHNTLLYPGKLWSSLATAEEVAGVGYVWSLTLDKAGGCHQLLDAGADGVSAAFLLSLGPFKFTKHHLELKAHPSELHRERQFGPIAYGNDTKVWVGVGLTEDNRAILRVSVESPKAFYACDAGCQDPPVQLSRAPKEFPVKLTEPFTPILYVTPDREHLEELRHTIHVSEVAEAAPHEHHLIALHKHGHRLGGLPWGFWAALALLIAAFHVFLLKLVLAEYCERDPTGKVGGRGTGRYSV